MMKYTGSMTVSTLTSRTALFTPANRIDRVEKALAGPADTVIVDLEDAVAETAKDSARQQLKDFLASLDPEVQHRLAIRINAPDTASGQLDLDMLGDAANLPAAIMVPKAEATGTFDRLPEFLDSVTVLALVETPTAVRDVHAIAALPRVDRLAIGAVDLSSALGSQIASVPIEAARAAVVLASAAAGLPGPLDTPTTEISNDDAIQAAAQASVRDGFGGMLCIHPKQLDHVTAAFTPSQEMVAWAERVIAAGDGAGTVDGQMIDRPVMLRAERILQDAGRSAS
ncbi:citrate lyase beta subunit [Enteractinococcus fodinae]|uniref:Citrate lyase beta subunit n=2 Tax=Enteractinococcus fodinae TaxID=684663 RepID=A0ABU2B658_9MICC|nr:citrate lyase beta subunit [Enteractinococcus fodinae]